MTTDKAIEALAIKMSEFDMELEAERLAYGAMVDADHKHQDRPLRGSDPTHWMPLPPPPEVKP